MVSSGGITADLFPRRIIIIAGGYGSGKSEVSVNLAVRLATLGDKPVSLADLDLVNPYFRSREAGEFLKTLGVHPINPEGGQFHADLPIVLPEIKGAIESSEDMLIIDAGGDDVGARVLASFADVIDKNNCDMFFVLNESRPFSSNLDSCHNLIAQIEQASRLKFSAIIANTHLIEHTTVDIILSGLRLAEKLSERSSLPIKFASVPQELLDEIKNENIDIPLLPINRHLLKPWERNKS